MAVHLPAGVSAYICLRARGCAHGAVGVYVYVCVCARMPCGAYVCMCLRVYVCVCLCARVIAWGGGAVVRSRVSQIAPNRTNNGVTFCFQNKGRFLAIPHAAHSDTYMFLYIYITVYIDVHIHIYIYIYAYTHRDRERVVHVCMSTRVYAYTYARSALARTMQHLVAVSPRLLRARAAQWARLCAKSLAINC